MTNEQYKKLCLLLAGAAIVCLFFALGIVALTMNHDRPAPAGPVAASETVSSALVTSLELPGGPFTGDKLVWEKLENGCTVTLDAGKVHFAGSTTQEGWDHWNGVRTAADFPDGDFTVRADFKAPQMDGPGYGLIYLRVSSEGDHAVGLLFQTTNYQLERWNPQDFSKSVKAVGDEATAYHRMTLSFDAAAQMVTGWIDSRRLGPMNMALPGKKWFWLVANTDRAGKSLDVYFENFTLTVGAHASDEPKLP